MLRKLAPSFVVTTVAAAGCHSSSDVPPPLNPPGPTAMPTPTVRPPAPALSVSPPTPAPSAARTTAKRRRTTDAGRDFGAYATVDWADLETLNPTDAQGRTVFVALDDSCYVEVPMKAPPPLMPTGSRAVDIVPADCPPAMDDPAWDTCDGSRLSRSKAKNECYCLPMGGNPPPPPTKNRCPRK